MLDLPSLRTEITRKETTVHPYFMKLYLKLKHPRILLYITYYYANILSTLYLGYKRFEYSNNINKTRIQTNLLLSFPQRGLNIIRVRFISPTSGKRNFSYKTKPNIKFNLILRVFVIACFFSIMLPLPLINKYLL